MNRLCAVLVGLLISHVVLAAGCGQSLTLRELEVVGEPLDRAMETVLQHLVGLAEEMPALVDSPAKFQRVSMEHEYVRQSHDAGIMVQGHVDSMRILLGLRELMVDKRDKGTVSQYVARKGAYSRKAAERATQRVNNMLTHVSRPGVAVDVSKLRDALSQVGEVFGKCD